VKWPLIRPLPACYQVTGSLLRIVGDCNPCDRNRCDIV